MSKTNIFSDEFDFKTFQAEAIERLKSGESLTGKDGILTPLIKQIIEASLEGEMEVHLSEGKTHQTINRRNGKSKKVIKTGTGSFELETPRDRAGSFEPQLIKKRQTVLNESLDNKILALYGLGMSYQAITEHLADMYGLDVSSAKISQITDKLLPVIEEWRNRPLDNVYPVVYLDAIHYKVREEGRVVAKAIYTILGLDKTGHKEVLGIYLSETEGARFWLQVLNDLKHRGIADILLVCVDGLKGFPEAIGQIFPQAEVQLCVIHQIRHSLRYVISKDQKELMQDLKQIYQANSKEQAEIGLCALEEKWGRKYAIVTKSWRAHWDMLSQYFKYPQALRRIVYTTNIIEGLHRQMRSFTKNKGAFTSENALLKLIYCACQKAMAKWTQPIHNWALIVSQLEIYFPGRLNLELKSDTV